MADFDCDLFVIGGGSGGVRAARMSAQYGARVILAEADALGGTCVNVGCIPKKLYSYAADYRHAFEEARGFGWRLGEGPGQAPRLDWAHLKAGRASEVAKLNGLYQQLLVQAGVEVVRGWARLADAHTVQVRTADGERRFTARYILIATGGMASVPELPGRELALTSDHMFDLEPFPRRLAIVGAGYIACEFASIFQALGAQVTLLLNSFPTWMNVERGP